MKRIVFVAAVLVAVAVGGYAMQAHASYCNTHCYTIGGQQFCNTQCF